MDITVCKNFAGNTGLIIAVCINKTGGVKRIITISLACPVIRISQNNGHCAFAGQFIVKADSSIIGIFKSYIQSLIRLKHLSTDEVFLTGFNLCCTISGNIQFLQFGKKGYTATVVNSIGIGISVAVGIHSMSVINAGNNRTVIQTGSIGRDTTAKLLKQPQIFVVLAALADVLNSHRANGTLYTEIRAGVYQHLVAGCAAAIAVPVVIQRNAVICILTPIVNAGVYRTGNTVLIHHKAQGTAVNQGIIVMECGIRCHRMAATIPPYLSIISIFCTLRSSLHIRVLGAVDHTVVGAC